MPNLAKNALPLPLHTALIQPAYEQAFGGTTLFSAPAGFLYTDALAGFLQEKLAQVVWMRLGPEDIDPAALLITLITGLAERFPDVASHTLEQMRKQPGSLFGWGPLFADLASSVRDTARARPAQPLPTLPQAASPGERLPFALVIEHIERLDPTSQTAALLWDHFLPLLPRGSTLILTRHADLPRGRAPSYTRQFGSRDLAVDERTCLAMAHEGGVRLPARSLQRLATQFEGRQTVLAAVLFACRLLGSEPVNRIVDSSFNLRSLLANLARSCLDASPPGTADLLTLALHLEHINPPLIQAALDQTPELPELFLQPLTGSWTRLRCIWHEPLRVIIRPGEVQNRDLLERVARFLAQQGTYEQAIPLLLDLKEPHEAAQVIVQVMEPLMDLGQWETISGWLKRLPENVRHDWPWLVYTEGEMAAAHGQDRASRKLFSTATRLFHEHRDAKGECQSLLTESCLFSWQNDLAQAQNYALQARTLADKNKLTWYQGWANWQLGCLSVSAGRLQEALAYFNSAGQSANDSSDFQMTAFVSQAQQLVQTQLEQQKKKAQYVQAYYEADRAEHNAAGQLRFLLANPIKEADDLRSLYGWSRTPLFLKLPPPNAPAERIPLTGGLLGFVRGILRAAPEEPHPFLPEQVEQQIDTAPEGAGFPVQTPVDFPVIPGSVDNNPTSVAASPSTDQISNKEVQNSQLKDLQQAHRLSAYLLGNFRIMINENIIDSLPSGRGRAIFAYLLYRGTNPVPREVIMDTFWPDASPESARNSLNVAIYSLRQSLKSTLDVPVILFQENAYHINSQVATWLDVNAFEQSIRAGREQEAEGKLVDSTRDYERALSLYQGDLLTDFPYEEWAVLERERLRISHLETMDHLSLIYFSQGQYAACVSLCQRILAYDTCREDAHCRLMRCYGRQGQSHLALRQYQSCVEALRSELNVAPSSATIQLYEQIRRRESV